jgi:hypothetical protein
MTDTSNPREPDPEQVEEASQQILMKLREKLQDLRQAEDLENAIRRNQADAKGA